MNQPIICDTPESIKMYRLLAIRSCLKLELSTGMRHSRNMAFNAAKQITGKKTRIDCLNAIQKIIDESA